MNYEKDDLPHSISGTSSNADDRAWQEAMQDFGNCREKQRRRYYASMPKRIGNVVAQVVQRKGYAQVRASAERDAAWRTAVGDELAHETEVAGVRRGVYEVLVGNSLLMQELTFRKEELLRQLQEAQPEAGIKQIRFRVGPVKKAH